MGKFDDLVALSTQKELLLPSVIVGGVGVLFYFLVRMRSNKKLLRPPKNITYDRQAISVPNDNGEDIRCSPFEHFPSAVDPNVKTVYDNFLRGRRASKDGPCLGYRTSDTSGYSWFSYGEVLQKALNFGSGLVKLGVKSEASTTYIGIYSKNCPEWKITELAAVSQSITIVPLYDTLGAEAVSFVINQAAIQLIVCDNAQKAEKLIDNSKETPTLKRIIVLEKSIDSKLSETAEVAGLHLTTFDEIMDLGAENLVEPHLPTPECTYIICYTSGTTGLPKGVIITHKNIISDVLGGIRILELFDVHMTPESTAISFLPLAHMFEQVCNAMTFYYGGKVGYFRGRVQGLFDDMKVLKPSVFPVVPRLLNRIYDKVESSLEKMNPVSRAIFHLAYNAKLREMKNGIVRKDSIWDRLVFNKLQKELGGNVELMFTGSAPIAPEELELSRVALGAVILEGYGQTENTAAATLTMPGDMTGGHVGGPIPGIHVHLADVPELEYWSREGKGEICLRGDAVTKGYLNDPEKTAEILDSEGWLHTGDVGMWLPDGTLKVVDRKKHIFKLAQGEYVAPDKIEMIYVRAPVVQQVFVDGNSFERYLVAIVVPDKGMLRDWLRHHGENGSAELTMEEMCANEKARKYVMTEMDVVGKENRLNSIEQVKAIHLTAEPFTVDNGLLTPTLKCKRPQLRKYYSAIIDQMYKDNKF